MTHSRFHRVVQSLAAALDMSDAGTLAPDNSYTLTIGNGQDIHLACHDDTSMILLTELAKLPGDARQDCWRYLLSCNMGTGDQPAFIAAYDDESADAVLWCACTVDQLDYALFERFFERAAELRAGLSAQSARVKPRGITAAGGPMSATGSRPSERII